MEPRSEQDLSKEKLLYLLALVDHLHLIYTASDVIHYGIGAVGLTISRDYIFEVRNEPEFDQKQEAFAEEQAQYELGTIGRDSDRISLPMDSNAFLDELDKAFASDLGFTLMLWI